MGREWENPEYVSKRRLLRLALVSLLLAAVAASAFWLLRRGAPAEKAAPAGAISPGRSVPVAPNVSTPAAGAAAETTNAVTPEFTPLNDTSVPEAAGARREADLLFAAGKFDTALEAYSRLAPADPLSRGRAGLCLIKLGRWDEAATELQEAVQKLPNDFPTRKWLALAFYRQNELQAALEQAQAALALQADGELLELQAKLSKEIRVQRDYDDARTANFVVLFDGREHDEIKYTVLDILKEAYADVGKVFDYFPEQPITVILYTAKDFSDITRAPAWAGGMFGKLDGKIRVPVQGAAGRESVLRRVLTHEYVHALLYALAPDCPMWLHEGLAQYGCGDEPVNIGQVIPLPLLVKGFPSEARAAAVAYMESLQAVVDLLEEHGMPRLRRLLDGLRDSRGLEDAFDSAYGQTFSRWAEQWRPVQRQE